MYFSHFFFERNCFFKTVVPKSNQKGFCGSLFTGISVPRQTWIHFQFYFSLTAPRPELIQGPRHPDSSASLVIIIDTLSSSNRPCHRGEIRQVTRVFNWPNDFIRSIFCISWNLSPRWLQINELLPVRCSSAVVRLRLFVSGSSSPVALHHWHMVVGTGLRSSVRQNQGANLFLSWCLSLRSWRRIWCLKCFFPFVFQGVAITYDLSTKKVLSLQRHAHSDDINSVCYLDDSSFLYATGGDDALIKVSCRHTDTNTQRNTDGTDTGRRKHGWQWCQRCSGDSGGSGLSDVCVYVHHKQ